MLTTIKDAEGKEYHAEVILLDDGHRHISPITDYSGRFVPATLCICSAKNSFECVCGAWERGPQIEEYDEEEE